MSVPKAGSVRPSSRPRVESAISIELDRPPHDTGSTASGSASLILDELVQGDQGQA